MNVTHKKLSWNIHQTDFFGQYWLVDNAKGIVAIVHGMGEHSTRYGAFFAPALNEAGFSVIAFDHFGHGKTKGKRGHCPSYEAVLDSVDELIEQATNISADVPVFLYGHSMGGNVVANYVLKRENHKLKGAIISSPMLELAFEPPAWKLFAGKIMKNIYPAFSESTGLDPQAISKDKKAVEKYLADPLVHDKITVNFSLPFFDAADWAIENAKQLKTPTLIYHGTGDQITSHKGSEKFAKNAPQEFITFKLIDGGYHELHNDPEKANLLKMIIDWLNKQL